MNELEVKSYLTKSKGGNSSGPNYKTVVIVIYFGVKSIFSTNALLSEDFPIKTDTQIGKILFTYFHFTSLVTII